MTNPAKTLLCDIQKLAPEITARASEIEAARRIPPDLVETLKAIGVFRIFVPKSHGGLELEMPATIKVLTALSKIDASIGWSAGIGAGASIFVPHVAREIYDRIYQSGPNAIIAGSMAPAGKAEAIASGWRVNGRWPFASGCTHADWFLGFCIMTKGGKALPGHAGADGPPLIKVLVLPARKWQIEDTWHVSGLKGTGSHHICLKDTLVREENFFDYATGSPCVPGPLYPAVPQILSLVHGAISLGIAEGALEDVVAVAGTGRQQLRAPAPMRDSETFQCELGRISADLKAARSFLEIQTANFWAHALAGTLKDEALLSQGVQAAIWIVNTCLRVTDACFTLAGGSALYESSPLQRRLRDIRVAAQHIFAQPRNYSLAGKLLLSKAAEAAGSCRKDKANPAA